MSSHNRTGSSYSYTASLSPTISHYAASTTSSPSTTTSTAFPFTFPTSNGATMNGATVTRHPTSSAPSHISKTYRQASTLFLTRRLPEALTTLLPLVTSVPGSHFGDGAPLPGDMSPKTRLEEPAPVATASRNTRIKVWSLYLTILNAVLEMEPDDGKDTFGAREWRALCTKVKEGGVWEDVVRNGYHGVEGDVDADVVINLATILLAHSRGQMTNQKRLENYLASAKAPNLDFSQHDISNPSSRPSSVHSAVYPSPPRSKSQRRMSGANTPRDLNARVKILELYTLHVLPRNSEWEYAREFISMSSVLDDERREAFLQALQSLQEQQQEQETKERAERERREESTRRQQEESARAREEAEKKREVEQEREREKEAERLRDAQKAKERNSRPGAEIARGPRTAKHAGGLGTRAGKMLWNLKAVIDQLGASLVGNPVMLTRMLAFVIGLLLMFSQQAVRDRVRRLMAVVWMKFMATAGMGIKTTSI